MSEHAPDRILSGIDVPKTIAGVLAAVSAAVVGSFLGVAGTLAGAAIASIVGSVGTEIYHRWIDKSRKKIATFVTAPAAVGTPEVVAAADETPSDETPAARKMRWGRMATIAAGLFVLAIGSLTAFELISGKSAADAVGHHTSSSTTVGSVFGGSSKKDTTPATTPTSTSPSPTTTEAPATTQPTTVPATTAPTQSAAPTETANPTPTATDTQTSGAGQNDQAPPATQGTE